MVYLTRNPIVELHELNISSSFRKESIGNPVKIRNEPVTVIGSYAQDVIGGNAEKARECDDLESGNLLGAVYQTVAAGISTLERKYA